MSTAMDGGCFRFHSTKAHRMRWPLLKRFGYEALPEHVQDIGKAFHDLAHLLPLVRTGSPEEMRAAMRTLLEARNAAIGAALDTDTPV